MKTCSFVAALLFLCLASQSATAQKTIHVPADQPTIQSAIDSSAANGDTVLVAPGIYYENLNFHGHNVQVLSSAGPEATILDGSHLSPVIQFVQNESAAAQLSGFTVRNGAPLPIPYSGGGVYISNTSPTIKGNIFTDNACTSITVAGGHPAISANTLTATHTFAPLIQCEYPGSAILLFGASQVQVVNNTITNNTEDYYGALLIWSSEDTLVQNNVFTGNVSNGTTCGGALCMYNSFVATVEGNYVANNSSAATQYGAQAMTFNQLALTYGAGTDQLRYGAPLLKLLSNTFVGTGAQRAQVYISFINHRTQIINNLFAGDTAAVGIDCLGAYVGSPIDAPVIEFNDADGMGYGTNCGAASGRQNLTVDPQLKTQTSGHMAPTNPALIDAGSSSVLPLPERDVDNNPRLQSNTAVPIIDIGAIESTGSITEPQAALVLEPQRYQGGNTAPLDVIAAIAVDPTPATPIDVSASVYANGVSASTTTIVSGKASGDGGAEISNPVPNAPAEYSIYATSNDPTGTTAASSVSTYVQRTADTPVSNDNRVLSLTGTGNGSTLNLYPKISGVAATDSGTLRIFDNGILADARGVTGNPQLTVTLTVLPEISHLITADYQALPSSSLGAFASSTALVYAGGSAVQRMLSLSAQPNPATYGQPVNLTATLTPFDSTVTATHLSLTEGNTTYFDGALDSNGGASVTLNALTAGQHNLTGTYSYVPAGSTIAITGSATLSITVQKALPALSLTATPTAASVGTSILFSANFGSLPTGVTPSGSITFAEGSNPLASIAIVNNTAAFATSGLLAGTHTITATYSGDNNDSSTSATAIVSLSSATLPPPPPDFSLTTPTLTLKTEFHGSTTLTLSSVNGFNGNIQIFCDNLPPIATCTPDKGFYPLAAGSTANVSIAVETSAIAGYRSALQYPGMLHDAFVCLLPTPLLFLLRRRKNRTQIALAMLAMIATLTLAGCSSRYPAHTPPGTYTLTIHAVGVSGNTTVTHTVPFTLTVTNE